MDLMGFLFWMETYGKLSHHHWVGNLLSMNFDIFLNKNTMCFFLGGETSMGLYITDPGIQDESSQKITSFQNLRESMWMRCLTFGFNCCLFFVTVVKKNKTRLAWTFSSTSLHMSELYWHTGIVIKSCGKQEKKTASVERGRRWGISLEFKKNWIWATNISGH